MNERNRRERESTAHELNRMNEPEWTEEASDKELPTQPLPRAPQREVRRHLPQLLLVVLTLVTAAWATTSMPAVVRATLMTSRLRVRADRLI